MTVGKTENVILTLKKLVTIKYLTPNDNLCGETYAWKGQTIEIPEYTQKYEGYNFVYWQDTDQTLPAPITYKPGDKYTVENLDKVPTLKAVFEHIPTNIYDIVYADGTTSTALDKSKTPIGIVIAIDENNFTTRIMSIKNEQKIWKSNTNKTFSDMPTYTSGEQDGYVVTEWYYEKGYDTEGANKADGESLVALRHAEDLTVETGDVAKWYVPSKSDLESIFAKVEDYNNVLGLIAGADKIDKEEVNGYWTSSQMQDYKVVSYGNISGIYNFYAYGADYQTGTKNVRYCAKFTEKSITE